VPGCQVLARQISVAGLEILG